MLQGKLPNQSGSSDESRESPLSVMLRVDTPLSVILATEKPLQLYSRFIVGLWNLRVSSALNNNPVGWKRAVLPVTETFLEINERGRMRSMDLKLRISYYPEVERSISSAYHRLAGETVKIGLLPVDLPNDPTQIPMLLIDAGGARKYVYDLLRKITAELEVLSVLKSIALAGDYDRFGKEGDPIAAIVQGKTRALKVFRKVMKSEDELSRLFSLALEERSMKSLVMLLAKSMRADAFSKFFYTFIYIGLLKDSDIRASAADRNLSGQSLQIQCQGSQGSQTGQQILPLRTSSEAQQG